MSQVTLLPEAVRRESRSTFASRRPRTLRAEAEALLRDVAYVCKLTERVRTELLAERADTVAAR